MIFLPVAAVTSISTHAPAGGATSQAETYRRQIQISTHAPAGGATKSRMLSLPSASNFYSRPCGRGDCHHRRRQNDRPISTHAPAGGATVTEQKIPVSFRHISTHAPAGGATPAAEQEVLAVIFISTHAPAGGATVSGVTAAAADVLISTHAPAGGATAIFHKSVMRFCGKLPKDDTVLCLASFGFPRRDPKAVYLA